MSDLSVLRAEHICKTFRKAGGVFKSAEETRALDDVSLEVARGEILGLVGESGCGKSTFARIVVGLERANAGVLSITGRPIFANGEVGLPAARRGVQMVFQDPYGSLNPRMRARDILAEGLRIRGGLSSGEIDALVLEHLHLVGLDGDSAGKYPHQFSGGQRQRLCIGRAIITKPQLLLADEAASALDVSVQMQILNLLLMLRDKMGLSILFISHDMGVIEYLCDRVAVMYRGRIVESGSTVAVLDQPRHPYTHQLIAARPRVGIARRARMPFAMDAQDENDPSTCCAYAGRCPRATSRCGEARPALTQADDHAFACFNPM